MSEKSQYAVPRKFSWVDKWAKMTGERAKIDAKVNGTYIVYETKDGLVKEFPDGKIIPYTDEEWEKSDV